MQWADESQRGVAADVLWLLRLLRPDKEKRILFYYILFHATGADGLKRKICEEHRFHAVNHRRRCYQYSISIETLFRNVIYFFKYFVRLNVLFALTLLDKQPVAKLSILRNSQVFGAPCMFIPFAVHYQANKWLTDSYGCQQSDIWPDRPVFGGRSRWQFTVAHKCQRPENPQQL